MGGQFEFVIRTSEQTRRVLAYVLCEISHYAFFLYLKLTETVRNEYHGFAFETYFIIRSQIISVVNIFKSCRGDIYQNKTYADKKKKITNLIFSTEPKSRPFAHVTNDIPPDLYRPRRFFTAFRFIVSARQCARPDASGIRRGRTDVRRRVRTHHGNASETSLLMGTGHYGHAGKRRSRRSRPPCRLLHRGPLTQYAV